jgi:hypothetical protein
MKNMRTIIFISALLLLFSCKEKSEERDFIFKLPQKDIFVKTSKLPDGSFFIYFAPDSLSLNDSKDFVEYKTGSHLEIFVDTTNIYVTSYYYPHSKIRSMGTNNFNIKELHGLAIDSFFEKHKYVSYSTIIIATKVYSINVDLHTIKEGDNDELKKLPYVSSYTFQLPGKDIFVKTSKYKGGRFSIYFALDSLSLNNSKDSIEFKIGVYPQIIVDATDIYVKKLHTTILNVGNNHFNIALVHDSIFRTFFANHKIKHPYSFISIDTKEYSVDVNGKIVKEGSIHGGW